MVPPKVVGLSSDLAYDASSMSKTALIRKPLIQELGLDLLRANRWEILGTLTLPFACAVGFFVAAYCGYWWIAVILAVVQSFFTYASISHDLVHRTLGLPDWLNEALLSLIELINFRSGHAFRVTHLHHHATFPHESDIEGRAAAMPWWRALIEGITAQPTYFLWAWNRNGVAPSVRRWLIVEGTAIVLLLAATLLGLALTPIPMIYAILILMGSWVFPFMTSFMPHRVKGKGAIQQTRLFRGPLIRWLFLDHLYHLEHHLYPQVPHHRWPQLAKRLDPFFEKAGIRAIRLWK